jgi:hypothetical protein
MYKDISHRLGSQVDLQQFVNLTQQRSAAIATVHAVKATIREARDNSSSTAYKENCSAPLHLLRTTANVTSSAVHASIQTYTGHLRA